MNPVEIADGDGAAGQVGAAASSSGWAARITGGRRSVQALTKSPSGSEGRATLPPRPPAVKASCHSAHQARCGIKARAPRRCPARKAPTAAPSGVVPRAEPLGVDAGGDEEHVEPRVVRAAEIGLGRVADGEHRRGIDRPPANLGEAVHRGGVDRRVRLAEDDRSRRRATRISRQVPRRTRRCGRRAPPPCRDWRRRTAVRRATQPAIRSA